MKPTQIVTKLCKDLQMEPPDYQQDSVTINGVQFEAPSEVENEHGKSEHVH